jgi:hypothetical protein
MRAWIVAAVLVAWTGVANARDGIVLESYTGPRPADASKLLAPLLEELQKREFEAGDSIGRLYEGKVSRPRTNSLPADFAKQLLAGQQAYLRGDYAGAVQDLQKLIDLAHDNSGAFAKNQALRQTMLDGLVALALARIAMVTRKARSSRSASSRAASPARRCPRIAGARMQRRCSRRSRATCRRSPSDD